MRFEFATPGRILFGPGTLEEAGPLIAQMGSRAFVVAGRTLDRAGGLIERLTACGVESIPFHVAGEPTTTAVSDGAARAREAQCDAVVGIGGGSPIDAAKAIAALLTNPGDLMDYLEVIGAGRPIVHPPAPCAAIPTTAGTGAEVTRNAVLGEPQRRVKVSMRSPLMIPRLAVVDPLLTHSATPDVTASTGLDALTQLLEVFVSNQANPMTDGICREGLRRAARSLRRAWEDGSNAQAREDMSLASLFGGLALANAKLGAVHGFAGVIGGRAPVPHGVVCARLLPLVIEANVRALSEREPGSDSLARFDEAAQLLLGRPDARATDAVAWIADLCDALRIPPLGRFGLGEDDFPAIVQMSQRASSMKGNPIALTDDELIEILRRAL